MNSELHRPAPSRPELTIVVPLHNEEGNIEPLHLALTQALERVGRTAELVLVDDGSTDDTAARLSALADVDPRVVVVTLRRNFGQTGALAAGFDHARGDIVVTMDGDMQHDPADLPRLLSRLDEGYDIVSGWRRERADLR